MTARGLRNFNPGNIRANSIEWEGVAAIEDRLPEQKDETDFVVFRAPWWGVRALAVILLTYFNKYGLNTVEKIIARYAPSHENHTHNYARFVANQLNVDVDDELDITGFNTLKSLVRAIIQFENGSNPYTWEITAGLILAGIEPKLPEF